MLPCAMSPDGRAPLSWAGTLVFLFIIPYLTDASSDYRILQGYDCDQLVGSGDVSLDTFGACGHAETVRASRNITYQLLQREKQREMAGTSCKMVETQQARYCGVYDHQTIFSQLSYTMIPISLSTDLCQLMKSQGYYEDPNGGRHKLQVQQQRTANCEQEAFKNFLCRHFAMLKARLRSKQSAKSLLP